MTKVKNKGRGFAGMNKAKQREIARRGGLEAAKRGTGHRWTSEEAGEAGKLGGVARAKKLGLNIHVR